MKDFLKERPWIWIVVLLGAFVLLDVIFFYVASSTQGEELTPAPLAAPAAERPPGTP